jgi:ornithine cyclodeaminase
LYKKDKIMPTMPPSDKALVPFVSVEHMMKLAHHIGIEKMLRGLAEYIEEDFRRWDLFDKTPRVASHSAEGVIELMPTSDGEVYGFKYVNGHPKNTRDGLQTVTAFGLLADVGNGYPVLLSEMTVLTALRTAATSAMVAKHLAPKGADTMAMIGNGAQSEFQSLAMKAICGLKSVRLWDIDPASTLKAANNLKGLGLDIHLCDSAEAAMEGAQIITTCTADKQYATILSDNMVGSGVHINAIGGDCPGKTELAPAILHRSDIFVEYPEQTRIEGEIQQLAPAHPVTELWQVITGQAQGRRDARQITLFDSVGFAIEDFSALRYIRDRIGGTDLYEPLDLGIARCRLMTAAPRGWQPSGSRLRVATKFVNVARDHFAARGVQADLIKLYGAMELAPMMGLADVIVDIVDTGNTLRAHGLEPLEEIARVSSRLVVNKAALRASHDQLSDLLARLEAALPVSSGVAA